MEVDDHEFESQSEDANSENESENVEKSEVERVMFTRQDIVFQF